MHTLRIACVALPLVALSGRSLAQVQPVELQTFAPPTTTTVPGSFGHALDVMGDLLVTGDPEIGGFPMGTGRAFVYPRVPGGWGLPIEAHPIGASLFDSFGFAVATDGQSVFISAPGQAGPNLENGVVYQFALRGGDLVPRQLLTASDDVGGSANTFFGSAMEVDGNLLAISANQSTGASIYVFERGSQGYVEIDQIQSPASVAPQDLFGLRISLTDGRLAVVAPGSFSTTQPTTTGRVFIYRREASGWTLEDTPMFPGLALGDNFGTSISLLGDRLLVGAAQSSSGGNGRAFAFRRFGSSWIPTAELFPTPLLGDDAFGSGVVLADNLAIVTASQSSLQVDSGGAAFLFERSSEEWFQTSAITPLALEFADFFGLDPEIHMGPSGLEFFSGAGFGGIPSSPTGSFFAFALENTTLGERLCAGSPANACPCGNAGTDTSGCTHTSGVGGRLSAQGSLSIILDNLSLQASDLPPNQLALPFVSPAHQDPAPVGDGLLCIGPPAMRLDLAQSNATGHAGFGPNLGAQTGWQAGETWTVQVAFRDLAGSPCNSSLNFTGALSLTLEP